MRTIPAILAILMVCTPARVLHGQQRVTLSQAIESALTRGPRVEVVRADSIAAAARVVTARAYPNPTAALSYTKSAPTYHIEFEQPFEYPFLRAARIRAAKMGVAAASYLANAERSAIRYEVVVAYANAAAGLTIRELSNQNVAAAKEMLRITREREQAGDASELEIRLAAVATGQAEMQAAEDSLQAQAAALQLQALMGIASTEVQIVPSDTTDFAAAADAAPSSPARVEAAQRQLEIERANVKVATAERIPPLALRLGVEWNEPDVKGLEPILGVSLPLPLWDRNRGPIAEARAAELRANADLALITLETENALALARQQQAMAQSKVERGRAVVEEAQKVAALSLTAYREGAYPLASVLEAQRNARDAVRSFVEALQASRIAQAAVLRAQTVGGSAQ